MRRREFLSALSAGAALAQTPAPVKGGKGQWLPSERRKYKDEVTGYEVWQMTQAKGGNVNLYFSCCSFTKDNRGLVFTSGRTGKSELFMTDMKSGRLQQLTAAETGVGYATVCPAANSICYYDNGAVWWLNIGTLETRKIFTIPEGYGSDSLSVDDTGRYAAFVYNKRLEKPVSNELTHDSIIVRVRTDGSGHEKIHQEGFWVSHVLINPTDPDTILFCHEGGWNKVAQRMWTVHVKTRQLTKIRVEETPEISVGHEYWTEHGAAVGYHGSYQGRQWLGRVNKDGTNTREWTLTAPTGHACGSEDGRYLVADGNIDFPYISLVRTMGNIGILFPLFSRGKLTSTMPHAHAAFSPDNKWIVFCSSRDGEPNVYLVRTPQKISKSCLA